MFDSSYVRRESAPESDLSSSGSVDAANPGAPDDAVREELARWLNEDDSRLGEVYRGRLRGLSPDQIAQALQVSTSNFVWNYTRTIKALLEGDLPSAPTVALGVARTFRALRRSGAVSEGSVRYLDSKIAELEGRATDERARVEEVQRAQVQTEVAEARDYVGIYVYALPHYVLYPLEPDSGRTLMKVGRSDSDVIQRFRNQTRTTALPEEPILLRIYLVESGSTATAESTFHRLLEAADHYRSVSRSAGREWFVTSTRFLDEVARTLKLPVAFVNDSAGDDD